MERQTIGRQRKNQKRLHRTWRGVAAYCRMTRSPPSGLDSRFGWRTGTLSGERQGYPSTLIGSGRASHRKFPAVQQPRLQEIAQACGAPEEFACHVRPAPTSCRMTTRNDRSRRPFNIEPRRPLLSQTSTASVFLPPIGRLSKAPLPMRSTTPASCAWFPVEPLGRIWRSRRRRRCGPWRCPCRRSQAQRRPTPRARSTPVDAARAPPPRATGSAENAAGRTRSRPERDQSDPVIL